MTDMDSGAQGRTHTEREAEQRQGCEEDENDKEESMITDRQQEMTHEGEQKKRIEGM